MHATWTWLTAAVLTVAASGAVVGGDQLRAVEVHERILRDLPSSELETYGPLLTRRIEMLKRFVAPTRASRDTSEEEQIKAKLFSNATSCPNPVAIFIGGGTGSGKSSLQDAYLKTMNQSCGFVYIDPDAIMMDMEAWDKMVNAHDHCAANTLHSNASSRANRLFAEAVANNFNVIYDGTMGGKKEAIHRFDMVKNKGYHVVLFGASVDTAEAAERAWKRADKTGRYVPLCIIFDTHTKFASQFLEYARLMPDNQLYDTSTFPPVLIYSNGTAVNATLLQEFQTKASETEQDIESKLTAPVVTAYKGFDKECGCSCHCSPSSSESSKGSSSAADTAHSSRALSDENRAYMEANLSHLSPNAQKAWQQYLQLWESGADNDAGLDGILMMLSKDEIKQVNDLASHLRE